MSDKFLISQDFISNENAKALTNLQADYNALGDVLERRNINIDDITSQAQTLKIAVPSWGTGTGGTRFARFPGIGEPRNIFEKLDDCSTINNLVSITPTVSLHIPWDKPDSVSELNEFAKNRGLGFDAMNSNTFQDQQTQELSYKFGSLSHADPAVRKQAIEHNIDCIKLGEQIGSKALTVWIGDGSNFPGQLNFRTTLEYYLESMKEIYSALPDDWKVFIEHKCFEPAFYSTLMQDWGTNYYCANELGPKAFSLVDLGHHAPNVNIEMIVSRLIQFGKLAGFHFNDSKYGDDDLDSGSVKPFQLFLVFNELVDAAVNNVANFDPSYMLDQSHNVTDPIESLMCSAYDVQRCYVQALIVDRKKLLTFQTENDVMFAKNELQTAFRTDVSPILAMARFKSGGAIDPIETYRTSNYRTIKDQERPQTNSGASGIV